MAADVGNVPPTSGQPTIIRANTETGASIAEPTMASQAESLPSRPAPPVPNRRAPVPPPNSGGSATVPVPSIHPAKRPLPPLPHELSSSGSKDEKRSSMEEEATYSVPAATHSAPSATHSAPSATQSTRNSANKTKRGRPVITVLEARPMNEVGFRGLSPTPDTSKSKPEIIVMSAKPMSEVEFRTGDIPAEPSSKPSGVVMRQKGRGAPPPRPTTMPARPPRPASQPSIKKTSPDKTEEVQTPNLIDFSSAKENQPPEQQSVESEGVRKPPPPRPVSRPQSLHFGGQSLSSNLQEQGASPSPDSSGYVSQVTTCESQPSLSSDGSEDQAQAPITRRRQFGVQVLPAGTALLKHSLTTENTAENQTAAPQPSPRNSRKMAGPPAPKPRGQKNTPPDRESPVLPQEGEERENIPKERIRPHSIMVLPPMPQQRSPSPKPRKVSPTKKEESNDTQASDKVADDSASSAKPGPPVVKPKPSIKPKPALKPKPAIAAKPKVASKPTVRAKPTKNVTEPAVNPYLSIVKKPADNDSFYEDKPDDSFYEPSTSDVRKEKAFAKEEEGGEEHQEKTSLYPVLSSLGDDGTIYPDVSRIVDQTKPDDKDKPETDNTNIGATNIESNKPELLEEDIKPVQKKRPTIIRAKRKSTPVKEEPQEEVSKSSDPSSDDVEPAGKSENVEDSPPPGDLPNTSDSVLPDSVPVRKPTIIRTARPRTASPVEVTTPQSPSSPPRPVSSAPLRPASPPKPPHRVSTEKGEEESDPADRFALSTEDLNRVKSHLVRTDSVSSIEQAENIVNEIRVKTTAYRTRTTSLDSGDSDHSLQSGGAVGGGSSLVEQEDEERIKPEVPEVKAVKKDRTSWVPPGAVRVMGIPPPLPRSGPVAVSTPDLRIDPTEQEEQESTPPEASQNPVRVLPFEKSKDMSTRSSSMMALHEPAAEKHLSTEGTEVSPKDGAKGVEEKVKKPQRPRPARPAPARPPPAQVPPVRPSIVPRKVPPEGGQTETNSGECVSRPKSGPPKPARSHSLKSPPKPPPPSVNRKKTSDSASPPNLPARPGPGHPLYHYVVKGPHGIALFDYSATAGDELSFKAGDVIELDEEISDGWMVGRNVDQKGMFPSNFIDVIEAPPVSHKKRLTSVSSSDGDVVSGVGPRCVARFDYEPAEEGDLSFVAGDVIKLTGHVGDEWLKGSVNGLEGIFPVGFVEIVEDLPHQADPAPLPVNEDANIVTATFDFSGEADELSFKRGDKVNVISQVDSSWLMGQTQDGSRGLFPSSYVDHIPEALPMSNKPPAALIQHAQVTVKPEEEEEPYCVAEFEFTSEEDGDLHFVKGDKIKLESHMNAEWMKGSLNGKTGMFPKAYVTIVKDVQDISLEESKPSGGETEESPMETNQEDSEEPSATVGKAIAIYEFTGETEEDLSLKVGDELILQDKIGEDWYRGSVVNSEKTGMFPAAFVKVVEEPNESTA